MKPDQKLLIILHVVISQGWKKFWQLIVVSFCCFTKTCHFNRVFLILYILCIMQIIQKKKHKWVEVDGSWGFFVWETQRNSRGKKNFVCKVKGSLNMDPNINACAIVPPWGRLRWSYSCLWQHGILPVDQVSCWYHLWFGLRGLFRRRRRSKNSMVPAPWCMGPSNKPEYK